MTEYSVLIGRQAERDILEAVTYIQEILFQPESARRIYKAIKTQINMLSEMPQRFAVIAEEPYRSMGMRKASAENYLIFYLVNEKEKTVSIVRVLHNRREWTNLL
ncbi:MAG: type II toxin-antitoxin system RelE/ParE family toxin [Clostridia bacterium]|nr:type II toxin-antitoxin system RelE/ParE family toxin [Clostridia bacterium]MBQ3227507.1 type II toxin-antitoxin system RelE/ParE family toxin [Clostridia bacterium]